MVQAAFTDFLRHDITDMPLSEVLELAAQTTTRNELVGEGQNLRSEVDAANHLKRTLSYLAKTGTTGKQQAEWEACGFKFGEDKNDLYRHVEFPEDWSLQNLEADARHLSIVDEFGRVRGGMSAKHTFYDRWAYCFLKRRFDTADAKWVINKYKDSKDVALFVTFEAKDVRYPNTAVLLKAGVFKVTPADDSWGAKDPAQQKAMGALTAWMDEHYPHWKSTNAYWDVHVPGGVFRRLE